MDPDHVSELFAGFGPVSVRRMFGGFGIYAGGRMFGLAYDGLIYLKADAATVPAFEGEGQGPVHLSGERRQAGADVLLAAARPAVRRSRGVGALGA